MTRFESRRADWLRPSEALQRVLGAAATLPAEPVAPAAALGRALARAVVAPATLPARDNSAMDGYAVRGADLEGATPASPVALRVVAAVLPGAVSGVAVEEGQAVRIMTGAAVPPGADSVVRVEDTDAEAQEAGTVRVRSDRDRGRNVRPAGEDMVQGDVVLPPGTTVGPGQVAVLAAVAVAAVDVHARPRVSVLSTGDELARDPPLEDVREGRAVPDSNAAFLEAALRAAGALPHSCGIARDTPASIQAALSRARGTDLLVTTGGASMGERDLLKRVLDEMGFELDFWRVRLRPGSPFSLGWLPGAGRDGARLPVLGLPGNPASCFVTFELFVRPLVLALAGHRKMHRPVVRAVAGEALTSTEDLAHFFRVSLLAGGAGGEPQARLTGPQGSGLVRGLGLADGLAHVPEGVADVKAGDPVGVILLGDGPGATERPPI